MGKLNKEIADCLHLKEGTVKVFLGPMFLKTGTTNRTELAMNVFIQRLFQMSERYAFLTAHHPPLLESVPGNGSEVDSEFRES
jgi:hypothetical protein